MIRINLMTSKLYQRLWARRHRESNPERVRKNKENNKAWRNKNNNSRNADLKKHFGITLVQWEELFNAQGKRCAACGSEEPRSKKGWSTDHCHTTQKVRGILCYSCNVGLGVTNEDECRLQALIEYLRKHNGS